MTARQSIRPRRLDTVIPAADIRVIHELAEYRRWLIEQTSPAHDPP